MWLRQKTNYDQQNWHKVYLLLYFRGQEDLSYLPFSFSGEWDEGSLVIWNSRGKLRQDKDMGTANFRPTQFTDRMNEFHFKQFIQKKYRNNMHTEIFYKHKDNQLIIFQENLLAKILIKQN